MPPRRPRDADAGRDGGRGRRPCRYHALGKCRSGASCRFSHDDGVRTPPAPASSRPSGGREGGRRGGEGTIPPAVESSASNVAAIVDGVDDDDDDAGPGVPRERVDAGAQTAVSSSDWDDGRARTSAAVEELRNRAAAARSCLSQMDQLMRKFRAQHAMAQQSLDDMQRVMSTLSDSKEGLSDAAAESERPAPLATAATAAAGGDERREEGEGRKGAGNEGAVGKRSHRRQCDVCPVAEFESYDEALAHERTCARGARAGAETGEASTASAKATGAIEPESSGASSRAAAPKDIPNELEDVADSAAAFLAASPGDFVANLRKELGVATRADLAEVILESRDALANIASGRATGEDEEFRRVVFDGVLEGREGELCEALLSACGFGSDLLVEEGSPTAAAVPTAAGANGIGRVGDAPSPDAARGERDVGRAIEPPRSKQDRDEEEKVRLRAERVAAARRKAAAIEAERLEAEKRAERERNAAALEAERLEARRRKEEERKAAALKAERLEAERREKEEKKKAAALEAERAKAAAAQAKRERKRREAESKRAKALEAEREAKAEEDRRERALAEKRAILEERMRDRQCTLVHNGSTQAEPKTKSSAPGSLSTNEQPLPSAEAKTAKQTDKSASTSASPLKAAKKSPTQAQSGTVVLYPTGNNGNGRVSPLFKLLCDRASLPKVRAILPLEVEVAKHISGVHGIEVKIDECNNEIAKIKKRFAEDKKKIKPGESLSIAEKNAKRESDNLTRNLEKNLKDADIFRETELGMKSAVVAEQRAQKKRNDVHSKHLAKFDAQVEALDKKERAIERDRDENLSGFQLERIAKERDRTLENLDKAHKRDLDSLTARKKRMLEGAEKEWTAHLTKLDRKKGNALERIKKRKEDKLARISGDQSSRLHEIGERRSKMLREKGYSVDGVLDAMIPRIMMSVDRRKLEDDFDSERREVTKKASDETKAAEDEAESAKLPVLADYESGREKRKSEIELKKAGIKQSHSTKKSEATESYEVKVNDANEKYNKKRMDIEQRRNEVDHDVLSRYQKDMAAFEQEKAKTTKRIDAQREVIQPIVTKAYEGIQTEFRQDMHDVEEYQAEINQKFDVLVDKLNDDYQLAQERVLQEKQDYLARAEMTEFNKAEEKDSKILEQRKKIDQLEASLNVNREQLDKSRESLSVAKGHGRREEPGFDISTLRDQFGNTLLIVAAQRNDVETASLCLQLGASPNETNHDGFSAMAFAIYFRLNDMILLLDRFKATVPKLPFDSILNRQNQGLDPHAVDWEDQLRISEQAAIPPDTFLASAEELDNDEDTKMPMLPPEEQRKNHSCFEARLSDPDANSNFKRIILLEKSVYNWLISPERESGSERAHFISLLRNLIPESKENVICQRRALVGIRPQFEVLCAVLDSKDKSAAKSVVHFSPYVSSVVRGGLADIGVLVWAVSSDSKASYVKALIEQAEFKRVKVEISSERFLPHTSHVLPLGKDMHLLNLKSTSSWKSGPMTLYAVGVDSGELERLESDVNFTPTTRTLESDRILRERLFRQTQSEIDGNDQILHDSRPDLSSNLLGGAGTGKTMLLIQKVASESPHQKLLVVARLPRLVSFIKSSVTNNVREKKGAGLNCDFYTYDELMNLLIRRCCPDRIEDERSFRIFNQIHYSETTSTGSSAGLSFHHEFIEKCLTAKDRNNMAKVGLESLTLWTAIRTIKSHSKCSQTLCPLSRKEYSCLPKVFGLIASQRMLAYDLFEKYASYEIERNLWDEADRVLYCLKHGGDVFSNAEFVSWDTRAFKWGQEGYTDSEDGMPSSFFYHKVFLDESQDFSDIDLALFIRLSSGVRSLFMGADPAQSVESGIRMRDGGINDVFHTCAPPFVQVKSVLQDIRLITNHRTHAQNLDLSKAVRRILSRSFYVPGTDENAISKGPIPEALLVKSLDKLGDHSIFKGVNVVFVTPDEVVQDTRKRFLKLGIKNDVFGVREAKGLEFDDVAVLGFFSQFEKTGSSKEWQNSLRWLFSKKGIKEHESSERVNGVRLEPCDYLLTRPELEDEAMMLYTAMTRARNHLYIIEDEESANTTQRRGKATGLGDFAFRLLKQLDLVKRVASIDGGEIEMTPQEHNARGVLLVTKAIAESNKDAKTEHVVEMFQDAADRFRPDKGCDAGLLGQCEKHLRAILFKRELVQDLKTNFFSAEQAKYLLAGRFAQILAFEKRAAKFVREYIDDPFIVDEVRQLSVVLEDAFCDSPYWLHFEDIVQKIKLSC